MIFSGEDLFDINFRVFYCLLIVFTFFMRRKGIDALPAARLTALSAELKAKTDALKKAETAWRQIEGDFERIRSDFRNLLERLLAGKLTRLHCGGSVTYPPVEGCCGSAFTIQLEHVVLAPRDIRGKVVDWESGTKQSNLERERGGRKSIPMPRWTIIGECGEGEDSVFDQLMELPPHALLELLTMYANEGGK